jgi:outer membrane putative beta-barrel porin/alpha-amylase
MFERLPRWPSVLMIIALIGTSAAAQELEPRALSNAPVGMNFLLVASGYVYGNMLLDPALPIEDGNARLGTLAVGYVRSIGVFGWASKIGFVVPSATGHWEAKFAGSDTSTSRTGVGDPILKLSVNFIGSPSLTMGEFRSYRQSTVVGGSLAVTVPVGQYFPDRLVNLGSNRWSFSPRLGASRVVGRWVLEGYAGATFYTTNDDFFGGKTLTQEPFFDVQAHAIYALRGPDLWAAGSVGHGWGGRSTLDGTPKGRLENSRLSLVLRLPLARGHGLKLAYINGLRTGLGADFDTFQIAYQYAWGGKR